MDRFLKKNDKTYSLWLWLLHSLSQAEHWAALPAHGNCLLLLRDTLILLTRKCLPGPGWVPSGLRLLLPKPEYVVCLSKWIFLSGHVAACFPRAPVMCCVRLRHPAPQKAFHYLPGMYYFPFHSQETACYLLNKP